MVVRCTGACIDLTRSQHPRLVLAPEAPRVLAPCDLSQMCKHEMPHMDAMYWCAKSGILHAHAQLNHINSLQAIY